MGVAAPAGMEAMVGGNGRSNAVFVEVPFAPLALAPRMITETPMLDVDS
jgi:hypothetical protein